MVGNGNVAMDLARILASPPEALAATDIAEHALTALAGNGIREIHVLGRRGPAQAAFTNKELKELGELPDVDVVVDPEAVALDPLSAADVEARPNRTRDRNLELLREYAARPLTGASTRIVLHFLVSPVEIIGSERVEALTIVHNELYESEDGSIRPRPTERWATIPLGLVFRAIGYQGVPLPGIPFDAMRGIIPNEAGRIMEARTGAPVRGEYVVGWIKRGPQGIIGTNKPDSQETVDSLLADLSAGHLYKEEVPSREVLERLLGERRRDFVSYEDWQLIDLLEQERGVASGAPRVKFSKVEEMLNALQERKRAASEEATREVVPAGPGAALDTVGEDALSDLVEAPEALGVDVQQLPRPRSLIAHHLRARCPGPPGGTCAGQHLADRRGRDAEDGPQARRPVVSGRTGVQDPRLDILGQAPGLAHRHGAPITEPAPAA